MQSNDPKPISTEEWNEIAALREVRELWGLAEDETGEDLSSRSYGTRFDFVSGGPGYCGDLFLVYGDAISGRPVLLARNQFSNRLELISDDVS